MSASIEEIKRLITAILQTIRELRIENRHNLQSDCMPV